MDKNTIKILVSETMATGGWAIIEAEINKIIDSAQASLLKVNPSDAVAVAKLQEKIDTLKKTLQIVKNMVI